MPTATVGGGCFWCLEEPYKRLRGVKSVTSGYAGGETVNPTYREVCSGSTGHAEVVQVEYNSAEITFKNLLRVFFALHDPTTKNREGPDVGSQYRSIILYHNDKQREVAENYIDELEGNAYSKIVTEVKPLKEFYRAEEKHQDYYDKNPNQPYCTMHIPPKLDKVTDEFSELISE